MSSQITVRLQEDLAEALDARARKTGARPSEIIRTALREHLGLSGKPGSKPAERVRRLIGSLESGQDDLAERHREYVLESLQRGR
jgi:metal-responsive CopG/Arc/MetJ family transcriptional regulator